MSKQQATINKKCEISGIGLHSGKKNTIKFIPAPANTGIIFRYKANDKIIHIPAEIEYVSDTENAITLTHNGYSIQTVEHLLSALSILQIDNLYIDVDNLEIPILDGSSKPFIDLFTNIKTKKYKEKKEILRILNPIWVIQENKYIIGLPDENFKITYTISFPHPLLQIQTKYLQVSTKNYIRNISPARTFGFYKDLKFLKNKNLAKGGNLENTLVLSDKDYINNPRFHDECVRHKILDLIGDLSLLNHPIKGHIIAFKAGHELDTKFVKKLKWAMYNNELLLSFPKSMRFVNKIVYG